MFVEWDKKTKSTVQSYFLHRSHVSTIACLVWRH